MSQLHGYCAQFVLHLFCPIFWPFFFPDVSDPTWKPWKKEMQEVLKIHEFPAMPLPQCLVLDPLVWPWTLRSEEDPLGRSFAIGKSYDYWLGENNNNNNNNPATCTYDTYEVQLIRYNMTYRHVWAINVIYMSNMQESNSWHCKWNHSAFVANPSCNCFSGSNLQSHVQSNLMLASPPHRSWDCWTIGSNIWDIHGLDSVHLIAPIHSIHSFPTADTW